MSDSIQQSNDALAEIYQQPVPEHCLLGWRYFACTEFIKGLAFVAWGTSTQDILLGLLIGYLMAALTWGVLPSL